MRTVAILGTNGLPAKYGGFETLVNHLVNNIDKEQFNLTVYCSKTPKRYRLKSYNGAKLLYFPFKANGWQSMIYDFVTIIHAFFISENLIILGFSGAFAFPFNKIFKRNIIFNIGGIEWKKVRGSKTTSKLEVLLKKIMERLCVVNSKYVIIDNQEFEKYIINKYRKTPRLIEYGGDHAQREPICKEITSKYDFLNENYFLSVSRAQEDMNIHLLIEAFKKVPNQKVVIVSNWNISDYGVNLYNDNYNKYGNIILLKAIYEPRELNIIRSNAKAYIHSHSLCGTAPSLVEAMSLGLPVFAFDVQTNRFTTENKAKYFKNSSELVKILNDISNSELLKIKNRMLDIANRRYTWKRITNLYQDCLSLKI